MKPERVLGLLFLLASHTFAQETLSAALAEWKTEIERLGKGTVLIVRVPTDPRSGAVTLPKDTPHRDVLVRYFRNPSFLKGFVDSHGMNINYQGPEGKLHFVLLNMDRADEWGAEEDAVLAHEFGHVWLHARNFPFPLYRGGEGDCAAIVAGDAVQHIVIRDEISRRGINRNAYWIRNLENAMEAMENTGRPENLPMCQALSRLGMWIDVRLGLSPDTWDHYHQFLGILEEHHPEFSPLVDELCTLLTASDVHDDKVHEQVLGQVLVKVYDLTAALPH